MKEPLFSYGPLARGTYGALIAVTGLVAVYALEWTGYYVGFLLFLGLGLRPVLEKTLSLIHI